MSGDAFHLTPHDVRKQDFRRTLRGYEPLGVEDWREALETAGFKNAIDCKNAPTEAEDPNWDPEDARYSVIRWAANRVGDAVGPHVHDPRSGEILSAHIIVWHDILKVIENWYFVQCAPLDPRARHLPLPDPLTGELLRYVIAHDVANTITLGVVPDLAHPTYGIRTTKMVLRHHASTRLPRSTTNFCSLNELS